MRSLRKVDLAIKEDKTVSPALIATIQMMLFLMRMLFGRSKLTSQNSSKPPSDDGNNQADDEKDKKNSKTSLVKRSKSRNILERLVKYETEPLLFAHRKDVVFSNNQGERYLRMTIFQQKFPGCFRSFQGVKIFCKTKCYLGSMQKKGINIGESLKLLFSKKCGPFAYENWALIKFGAAFGQ